jgi:glyoxylase-like metal-dependent hydrolase (beta-lactamase superfamily II)
MAKYEIIPMVLGRLGEDKSAMMYFTDYGVKINLPVVFFYIKGGEKNILVDTGCPAVISKVYHPNDPVSDIQSFEEALAKQGLKPEDIDIVIQTHLHYDHCANTGKCTNARVIIQEDEIRFALAPHPVFAGMYFKHLLKDLRFQPVKGDTEIVSGVKVLFTPGHTVGCQSVAVETTKGTAIITGFCSIRQTFEVPPETAKLFPTWFVHTPGIHTDALAAFDSALRVKWLADILIPSHEPELEKIEKIP